MMIWWPVVMYRFVLDNWKHLFSNSSPPTSKLWHHEPWPQNLTETLPCVLRSDGTSPSDTWQTNFYTTPKKSKKYFLFIFLLKLNWVMTHINYMEFFRLSQINRLLYNTKIKCIKFKNIWQICQFVRRKDWQVTRGYHYVSKMSQKVQLVNPN